MKKNAKLITVFLFTVFLAVIMAVAASAQTVSADVLASVKDHPGYMIDYDGNDVVNEEDAIYLLYHSFMPTAYPLTKCENKNCTADVNRDSKVDSDDAIFVLYATFGLQNPCPLEKHTEVKVPGVAPTCTKKGIEGGGYCSYCGDFTVAPKIVDVATHMSVLGENSCFICGASVSDDDRDMIVWFKLDDSGSFYSVYDATVFVKGKVDIPAMIDGKSVNEIANNAFFFGYGITEVVIPESVTSIGNQAFSSCSELVKVTIPKSVTKIGKSAFGNCTALKSITIPASVTELSQLVFYGCTALENVYFAETSGWYSYLDQSAEGVAIDPAVVADPVAMKNTLTDEKNTSYSYKRVVKYSDDLVYTLSADGTYYTVTGFGECNDVDVKILSVYKDKPVKAISDNAFKDIKTIRSVDIPIGVTSIGKAAFSGCTALVEVDMPDSVTTIGASAFSGCTALTDINLSTAIKEIGAEAFNNCTKLVSVTVPSGVKKINNGTFLGCSLLENVTLPSAVSVIGAEAFKNCPKLASVNIPTGLVKIEKGAFYGCSALTSVVLPDGMTSIGSEAFRGCTKLTTFAIPSGIKTIESNMFYGCSELKKVTIPSSVVSIAAGAFQNCSVLTDITLPSGISSIASNVFNGCKALKSITIPAGVRTIGVKSFSGCSALESIILPAGLDKINSGAFEKCTALKSVTFKMTSGWGYADTADALEGTFISASVLSDAKTAAEALTTTYVSKYWTRGEVYSQDLEFTISDDGKYYIVTGIGTCTDIEVTVPATYKGLPVAEISSFDESVTVSGVYIPGSVKKIGDSAFKNCFALSRVVLCYGLETIGEEAFSCTAITSVDIPASVTSIGAFAFENCQCLEEVVFLGNKITDIELRTFNGCNSLKDFSIPSSVTYIAPYAFCDTLITSLTVPSGVNYIGYKALPSSISSLEFKDTEGWQINGEVIASDDLSDSTEAAVYVNGINSDLIKASKGLSYTLSENGAYYIVSGIGTCADKVIIIPEEYNGVPVRAIGAKAFRSNINITEVVFNSRIFRVEAEAFSGCKNLVSIAVTDSTGWVSTDNSGDKTKVVSISASDMADPEKAATVFVTSLSATVLDRTTLGLDYTLGDGGKHYVVTGIGSSNDVSVVIPEMYDDLPVREIAPNAFSYYAIGDIYLPDSIEKIGTGAFANTNIRDLFIPASVTYISDGAFNSCGSLKRIVLSDGVVTIGDYAFGSCDTVESINIPASVKIIGVGAFSGCSNLENVTFKVPSGWIYISDVDSDDAAAISATKLGVGADAADYLVNKFTQKLWIRKGNDDNSTGSKGLAYTLSNNGSGVIVSVGSATDKKIVIPSTYNGLTVVGIDSYGFSNCSSIESVTIPDTVTEIGRFAFSGCGSIKTIDIPDSVTYIGDGAFNCCSSLESIEIPEGIDIIDDVTFFGCTSLATVNIPGSVVYIGSGSFYDCTKLASISLPANVKYIGDTAFSGCTSIKTIVIPSAVTEIGRNAFSGCSSLVSVSIPSKVKVISDGMFADCSALKAVTLPSGATEIGKYVFENCVALTAVQIPAGVTEIADGLFSGCTALTSVNIPENVTYIGEFAFANCKMLPSVDVPSNVTFIGACAFANCSKFTAIAIPSGVTTIEAGTFLGCSELLAVNIPAEVTSIGNGAFSGCSKLVVFYIPEKVTHIGRYAFDGCSSLAGITFAKTEGWWYADTDTAASGTAVASTDIANSSTVAEYLTDTYKDMFFNRT